MKKILFLAHGIFKIGGIQKFNNCLLDALVDQFPEKEIIILSLNDLRESVPSLPENINIDCFGNIRPRPYQKALFSWALFLKLLQEKPNVIICGHINFSVLCLFMRFIFRIPYVVITHGIDVWTLKGGLKYQGLSNADLVTTVSRYTRSRMVSHGINEAKIVLLFNTVDTDFFIPKKPDTALKTELGLEGKKVLLTVSRLALTEQHKGHAHVLQSLQLLNDEYVWIVVGVGDAVPLLKQQAQELGVIHKVRFVGSPDATKLVDFYNLCDVFILPSKKEGFGIVYIEAMSCGKPVIAGNQDGSCEPLLDGELGFLVDPDDLKNIVRAIEAVFDRSDQRTDPLYLRTRVQHLFGLAAFGKKVKEIFSKF